MTEVIESENKLTFILKYSELNFKYYNAEYFLKKGLNTKVFILMDNRMKGGNTQQAQPKYTSLTIPYRYFFNYSNYIKQMIFKNGTGTTSLFMELMNRIKIVGKYIGNFTENLFKPTKRIEDSPEIKPVSINEKLTQKITEPEPDTNKKEEDIFNSVTEKMGKITPVEIKETEPYKEPAINGKPQVLQEEQKEMPSSEKILTTVEKQQILSVDSGKKLKIEFSNIINYHRISDEEEADSYVKMFKIYMEKRGKIFKGNTFNYLIDGEVVVIGNIEKECQGVCVVDFSEEELKEIENTMFYKEVKFYME